MPFKLFHELGTLDSEGFELQLSAYANGGKALDQALHETVSFHERMAMFDGHAGDVQCGTCEPLRLRSQYGRDQDGEPVRMPNPKGWQEVDGVKLPPITWAEDPDSPQGNSCPCGLHGDRYCRSIGCPRS